MKNPIMMALMLLIVASIAFAQDKTLKKITLPDIQTRLVPGEGRDKTESLCGICHSLDYITTQPRGSRAQWTATVTKMRKVMGAPISDADAEIIIKYLSANYGTGK